jgi:DNA repair exonuclease SbcCD nuclease subunit
VVAFPWAVRSLVLAQPDFKNCTIAELNQAMINITRDRLRTQVQELDPELPSIIVGHAHLFGARVGAERLLTMGSDPMYDLQTFDLPGVDYVALGHIHKHQVLHYASPRVVYAGSIDRVDFGEQDEQKGWVYIEIAEKGHAEFEFRPVRARPFLTIDARVVSDNATEDVAPFERTNRQQPRNRWGNAGAELQRAGPLEALALYLEHQKVDSSRRDVLLRYARALMTEDEPGGMGVEPPWTTKEPPSTSAIEGEGGRGAGESIPAAP